MKFLLAPLRIFRGPIIRLRVVGESMSPTFCSGQYIWVNRLAYKMCRPKSGDVVVMRKKRGKKLLIKRVAACGNSTVEQRWGRLFCNRERLGAVHMADVFMDNGEVQKKWQVAPAYYFVLGDNPLYSTDSRDFGPVHSKNILGKVI